MVRELTINEQYRVAVAGTPYRPSNGTDGMIFFAAWCERCERDRFFQEDDGDSCPILLATVCYELDDPKYPPEWVHDEQGRPMCTAYKAKDGKYGNQP